jgi:hypothetical protein
MTPKEFQQALCKRIVSRLHAQGHKPGKKQDRAALELLCGACLVLEISGSDQLSSMLFLTSIAASRGSASTVANVAETGKLA